MALLWRRPALPDDVGSRLTLAPGDRVLAHAELRDGWAVVSRHALHVARGASMWSRPWSEVDGAALDPQTSRLTVRWVGDRAAEVLELADDRDVALPRALHERVQSSVVHLENVTLPNGAAVRVVLRRGAGNELLTQVLGTDAVDLSDPETARLVDDAEARVRGAAGLR